MIMEVGYSGSACFAPKQAIQDYSSSNLSGNFPCRAFMKHPVSQSHSSLIIKTQTRSPKSVVSALTNDKGLPGKEALGQCTDDVVVINPEDDGIASSGLDGRDVLSMLSVGVEALQLNQGGLGNLLQKLRAVHQHILAMEQLNASNIQACQRNYTMSAINLIHYLAVKSLEKENLQKELSSYGLLNAHVLPSLSARIRMLEQLETKFLNIQRNVEEGVSCNIGLDNDLQSEFTVSSMLKKASDNSNSVFGMLQSKRTTHIMVTVGHEVAEDDALITDLINAGTTIFRINCEQGNPSGWIVMIKRIKNVSVKLEKPVRILMDLAGPKLRTEKTNAEPPVINWIEMCRRIRNSSVDLKKTVRVLMDLAGQKVRTGKMKAGPRVIKISPKKDALGRVICPSRVWLTAARSGPPPAHVSPDVVLRVYGKDFLSKLEIGNVVKFRDARGKRRTLKVTSKVSVFQGVGLMCECSTNAYVESGTKLKIKGKRYKTSFGLVEYVPLVEELVRVKVGDLLIISRDDSKKDDKSVSSSPNVHRVTCSSGYLFDSVKPGEPISFDDGKIWGVINGTSDSHIDVSITRAGRKVTKLGSDKSINIPESSIRCKGLTSKDINDLNFVGKHADMAGFSFVRSVEDIVALREELSRQNSWHLSIILKIETQRGFENLPFLLLEAMKSPNPLGVMIATGDLAVECGWERLAEIQKEILSISRAAHVPVIWATQVLESLVNSGIPTRAEITDVAAAKKANCIMLNKGKYITDAVKTLDKILSSQ